MEHEDPKYQLGDQEPHLMILNSINLMPSIDITKLKKNYHIYVSKCICTYMFINVSHIFDVLIKLYIATTYIVKNFTYVYKVETIGY